MILKQALRKQDLISVVDNFQPDQVCNILEYVFPLLDLLVIWDFITTNYRRLILQKSFNSNQQVTCVNSVTLYVGLQLVWEVICTRPMSTEKTANLFVRHTFRHTTIYSARGVTLALTRIEMAFICKKSGSHNIYRVER